MIYILFRHRRPSVELDAASDLIARQFAQADYSITQVDTRDGRVVYRRTPLSDIDINDVFKGAET